MLFNLRLDLLCFLLSGLPANGTIAAEVAFMFNEWYKPNSCLDFPVGGSKAMVDALVRCGGLRGIFCLVIVVPDDLVYRRLPSP